MCCDGADTEPMVWLGSLPPGSRICFTTTIRRRAENEIKLHFLLNINKICGMRDVEIMLLFYFLFCVNLFK